MDTGKVEKDISSQTTPPTIKQKNLELKGTTFEQLAKPELNEFGKQIAFLNNEIGKMEDDPTAEKTNQVGLDALMEAALEDIGDMDDIGIDASKISEPVDVEREDIEEIKKDISNIDHTRYLKVHLIKDENNTIKGLLNDNQTQIYSDHDIAFFDIEKNLLIFDNKINAKYNLHVNKITFYLHEHASDKLKKSFSEMDFSQISRIVLDSDTWNLVQQKITELTEKTTSKLKEDPHNNESPKTIELPIQKNIVNNTKEAEKERLDQQTIKELIQKNFLAEYDLQKRIAEDITTQNEQKVERTKQNRKHNETEEGKKYERSEKNLEANEKRRAFEEELKRQKTHDENH